MADKAHFCQMESDAQITLVDRAAVVVATSVWCHGNVVERIRNSASSKSSFDQRYWVKTKLNVNKNIHSLPLPACTKQRVEDLIVFIDKGIKEWMQDHYFLTIDGSILSTLLCWKSKGVIDCIATAEKVISHEKDIINCFKIACMYCLENDIFRLWDLIEHENLSNNTDIRKCFEVEFYISYIKEDMNGLMDENQYTGKRNTSCFAFNMSVKNNNAVWTEHFLKKMREDQMHTVAYSKLKCILEMPCAHEANINYKMIPLLSRYVKSEIFNDLIRRYTGTILFYFLQFPTIKDFLKIANKTWDVLTEEDFFSIIEKMTHFLQEYGGNQIFRNVFVAFWSKSPDRCKIHVIEKCIECGFLIKLGLLEHSYPIIKLIFRSSTTDQKKKMIFSDTGITFFDTLIEKNRWDCFSMSIQELAGSEDRINWINKLIRAYRHIFKRHSFLSFTSTNHKKFIDILEKEKNKNI